MSNRYTPNEAACPVPLELLALLLRSDEARISDTLEQMPEPQRARLAAFCYSRIHMRKLAFEIARRCDRASLRMAAGTAGEALFDQSRDRAAFDAEPLLSRKAKVTLARVASG